MNPAKVKEKVVEQLKTQIVDLERFIEFLQGIHARLHTMQPANPHTTQRNTIQHNKHIINQINLYYSSIYKA